MTINEIYIEKRLKILKEKNNNKRNSEKIIKVISEKNIWYNVQQK
jgi:hypothetical protein